jgi:outer membrane protein OmpA-like peptidoglycan-associated protein
MRTTLGYIINLKRTLFLFWVFIFILKAQVSVAQNYHKDRARYYKNQYKKTSPTYKRACDLLEKKKKRTKNKKVPKLAKRENKTTMPSQAEREPVVASAKPSPSPLKPKPATTTNKPTFEPSPIVSKKTLDELHKKEDQVLKLNNLPAPSSEKHEEIRRLVANTIANKKDSEPIELEPLYFTFDQDEFSVVDMDPFLIAVEFALQGKHILIEGHTDHEGKDDYNVQLSIKRVEKIRQLMREMGVPDDRISVVGYGEEVTDHADKTDEGRQKNRRVDFKAF